MLEYRYSAYRSTELHTEFALIWNPPHLTDVSREASQAETLEAVDFILAVAPIQTRVACAFIDVSLAVIPNIARWAETAITVH